MVPQRFRSLKYLPLVLLLVLPAVLTAATVSGVVKDNTGAVIPRARIEIRGGELVQPLVATSDGVGRFTSADLKP